MKLLLYSHFCAEQRALEFCDFRRMLEADGRVYDEARS